MTVQFCLCYAWTCSWNQPVLSNKIKFLAQGNNWSLWLGSDPRLTVDNSDALPTAALRSSLYNVNLIVTQNERGRKNCVHSWHFIWKQNEADHSTYVGYTQFKSTFYNITGWWGVYDTEFIHIQMDSRFQWNTRTSTSENKQREIT